MEINEKYTPRYPKFFLQESTIQEGLINVYHIKLSTMLRKKGTDGLYYIWIYHRSGEADAKNKQTFKNEIFQMFLLETYNSINLTIVPCDIKNHYGQLLYNLDPDQVPEEERIRNSFPKKE